ncbi:MAG: RagB/SusD family nutrient uptake outer membrane protein [Bacteroidales bacterium]|nr:RagB/SusD family nutrient uptake outer membrane protein [Bacteroidales bacterium]
MMKTTTIMIRKFTLLFLLIAGLSAGFTSCDDILFTQSDRYMSDDGHTLGTANDSVYTLIGILTKVQQLSDRYVLTGELRADLLNVTPVSESFLRELNSFTIDKATSEFADVKDYYGVINNCNYLIAKADTNLVSMASKPFVKEVAAAKAIRAWTYFQLVLNYGQAKYYEKPIISVTETRNDYPVFTQEQMIDTLIAQLVPLVNVPKPSYGTLFGVESKYLFIEPMFLLGDLYLWKASRTKNVADYEMAATWYARLMDKGSYVTGTRAVRWMDANFKSYIDTWSNTFLSTIGNDELISVIQLSSSGFTGNTSRIYTLCQEFQLGPTDGLLDTYALQNYAFVASSAPTYTSGDLREKAAILSVTITGTGTTDNEEPKRMIFKYLNNTIQLYRVGLLYLRYAEAVNRAGKPGLAFAVLKYGLNPANLANNLRIPATEVADAKEYIRLLDNDKFNTNVGLHNRGSGNSEVNTRFAFPLTLATLQDSILFVEDNIVDELAMETAFEGNRFHDLMRFSEHRNDPGFLAHKVAQKHPDYNFYLALLKDKKNWYLPQR